MANTAYRETAHPLRCNTVSFGCWQNMIMQNTVCHAPSDTAFQHRTPRPLQTLLTECQVAKHCQQGSLSTQAYDNLQNHYQPQQQIRCYPHICWEMLPTYPVLQTGPSHWKTCICPVLWDPHSQEQLGHLEGDCVFWNTMVYTVTENLIKMSICVRDVPVLCRNQNCPTNCLNPQNRVLLSSIAHLLIKKFSVFYAPCRFIQMFTTAHHLSIFDARWNLSMLYHPTLKIHFNIILPPTPRSSKWPGIWLTLSLTITHTHTHTLTHRSPSGQDFNLLWQVLTNQDEIMWLQVGFPSSAATAQIGFPSSAATAQITFSSVKLHPSLIEIGCCRNLCSSAILHPLKIGGIGVPQHQ